MYKLVDLAIGDRTPKPGQRYTHGWVKLVADTKEPDGGFSRNPIHDSAPTSGYMVSQEANGRNNKVVPASKLTTKHLAAHAKANEAALQDPQNYQGAWHDPETGLVHLDISRNVQDKAEAIKLAKQNNQIAIFDLKTFNSIPTGGTGEKKASHNPTTSLSNEVDMSNSKQRTLLTPMLSGKKNVAIMDLSDEEGLTFWKEVLPETTIDYDGQKVTFDADYHQDLVQAYKDGAYDQVPFMLANNDNQHTMDPERYRGETIDMTVGGPEGEPGVWAKIKFASKAAAEAVTSNPKLGVSLRIKEGLRRADGKSFNRAVAHVLGTLDPRVTGMSPWRAVELSATDSDTVVLDMTSAVFSKGKSMPKSTVKTAPAKSEEVDFDSMTDEELDAFIENAEAEARQAEAELAELDEEDDEEVEELPETDNVREKVGVALSTNQQKALDLANGNARVAMDRANESLRRAAEREWAAERAEWIDKGVAPADLDLCAPVLNRPDAMVIDLSNDGGKEKSLDVSKIVRTLLERLEGTVDLSSEQGHIVIGDENDADKAILAAAAQRGGF